MRRIILNLAVTLDGYIEGPNGEIDWCRTDDSGDTDAFFDSFLPDVDAIFYGRISYDLWGQYQPSADTSPGEKKIWDMVHSKKKYVFSRTPRTESGATFISSDITSRVNEIRNEPGKNIWLYGGGNLITEFINADLVDTYLLAIFPVLLGSGKLLFSGLRERKNLKLETVDTSKSGVMLVNYSRK